MSRYIPTERIGVNAVESAFLEMGWIPRTVFQTDVGIDMLVEIVNEKPSGKFIAVQIKSGNSYFKETVNKTVVFRANKTHIDYWLDTALPVIIVLYNPDIGALIWESINRRSIVGTGENFKIFVPLDQILSVESKDMLERLISQPLANLKFQRLLFDKEIIDLINSGQKVVVKLSKYMSKLGGRADIEIIHVTYDDDFEEVLYEDDENYQETVLSKFSLVGIHSYQYLYFLYPWADFSLDNGFYEAFSDYDEDKMPGYKLVFHDDRFRDYKLPIIPYHNDGEKAHYRLEFKLNEYGYSFLDFYSYLMGEKQYILKL